jgi:heme A synthase
MLTYLLAFFILVMAGGAGLAVLEHRGRALPLPVSLWHGLLGIAAIVWLLMTAMAHPGNHPVNLAIIVFMLTALGGLLLFAFRASKQKLPLAVVVLHGCFAVIGLTFLCVGWSRS